MWKSRKVVIKGKKPRDKKVKFLSQAEAQKLVEDLEAYAKKHDCHVINVTSSITSKPFFESKGYTVIEEQINERRGERLLRYLMEKKI